MLACRSPFGFLLLGSLLLQADQEQFQNVIPQRGDLLRVAFHLGLQHSEFLAFRSG